MRRRWDRLSELRKRAGLTQAMLAERVGCGANHIAKLEGGQRGAGARTRHELAAALGVAVDKLGNPPTPPPQKRYNGKRSAGVA